MAKLIRDRLTRLEKVIERLLFPVLGQFSPKVGSPDQPREDATLPRFVSARLEAIELHLIEIFDDVELDGALEVIGRRVSKKNGTELQRVVGIAIRQADQGIGAQLEGFRQINVQRIKSLAGQELVQITQLLQASEGQGLRVEVLRKQIQERFSVTKGKADLLARDQTLTLNAQIARNRQTNLGIESYVWTTSGDDRVRDGTAGPLDHAILDGETFRWDNAPDVGDGRRLHPGEDFQCRCTAFPVLPELA